MYYETWIGMIVSLVLFPLFYFYAVRPADTLFKNALIEKGVIKQRDSQLFMQQTHSFYSRKITSLNAISEKLVEKPLSYPKHLAVPFKTLQKLSKNFILTLLLSPLKM